MRLQTLIDAAQQLSPRERAEWALERVPEPYRCVLSRARAIYLGEIAEAWDGVEKDIVPCIDYLIDEIRSIASASGKDY